jgi:NADPH2:quinone reductase
MKAIVVREFGAPQVMKLETVPDLRPAAGQILVRIHAAGVNPADTYTRTGTYAVKPPLPYTPGTDGAGVVERVGAGVTQWKSGDRVYVARAESGTYAEFALALESQLHPLPENVNFAQGAGVFVPYGTAYHALHHHAHARAGETVLVHGASGGVGVASVQMARAMGLTVFGTAGTDRGLELAQREGAHRVFNHRSPEYRDEIVKAADGRGMDIILEMLANVNLGNDLKLIATNGRVIVIGSRGDVTVTPRDLMARRGRVAAFTLWGATPAESTEIHAGLVAGLANGTLRPVVGKELPLAEAPRAHEEVMQPGAFGKIALLP